jgi:16S rRNA (guanine527-N7)-methyltransferase
VTGSRSRDWDAVERAAGGLGISIGAAERERIDRYVDLLCLWNRRLRLTGEHDRSRLITRHVADSLACVPLLPASGSILDLGSGAGLPGFVLACMRPDLRVLLVDSRERPITFLLEAAREIGLSSAVPVLMRIEQAASDPAIAGKQLLVVCRAVRLEILLASAGSLLVPGGFCVSMQSTSVSWETAARSAAPWPLDLAALLDYPLPDDDPRRLVVWRRR